MRLTRIVWLSAIWIVTLRAQELYIFNETVYISNQDTVAVVGAPPGDLQVDGTGIFENDGGVVWLTGDWINTSSGDGFVTPRNGWLYLVGGYQRLFGPTPTYYNSLALFNNVGLDYAGPDARHPWRYWIGDTPFVSNSRKKPNFARSV